MNVENIKSAARRNHSLPLLLKRKVEVVNHLQKEWDGMERAMKKERFIQIVKETGSAFGKGLFAALLIGGAISVAMVAPNIFAAIPKRGKRKFYFTKGYLQKELRYFKRHNYIKTLPSQGEKSFTLTVKGEERGLVTMWNNLTIPVPPHWDTIWRIVIFDIPDRQKPAREAFRGRLKALGFYRMQESVFVFPYPCKEELSFLVSLYQIRQCIRYIETNHIEHDADLRLYFNI